MRKAFTLIEILIAITIIAILSAITLGVVMKAKSRATMTTCLSNQRQLGMALLMYIQDYDEVMPVGNWERSWPLQAQPYLSTRAIDLRCPAYERGKHLVDDGQSTGYAMNGCLIGATNIPSASMTVLVAEAADVRMDPATDFGPTLLLWRPDTLTYPALCNELGKTCDIRFPYGALRHSDRSHYSFVDSHTRLLSPGQLRISDLTRDGACPTSEDLLTGRPGDPAFPLVQ